MRVRILLVVLVLCLGGADSRAQPARRNFYPGDWVSFVPQRFINGMAQGFDILYLATPHGVGRYSTLRNRFLPPLTVSGGLEDPNVLRIAFDMNFSTLWVLLPLGSMSYNEVIGEWRTGGTFPAALARDDARSLRFPNLFTPWEVTYLPPDRASPYGMFTDRELRRYPINTALTDATNRSRIWIGAWGYGLGEVDKVSQDTRFHRYGLYQQVVQALYKVDDRWYFAGRGQADEPPVISVFDTGDSTWSYRQPFFRVAAGGDVTSIAALGEEMFYGTPRGLLKEVDEEKWRTYTHFEGLPDDHITALYPDGQLLWVGTRRGPGLLDPQADTGSPAINLATARIGSDWVYCFLSAYGYIWAGTETGLYRIRQDVGDWGRITTEYGLLRGRVRGLELSPEGIWCATDRGLILIDSALSAREAFRANVEIPDGDLFSLAVDSQNLWAGGRSGVWRYIRKKGVWRHYTRNDGLLDDFVYAMRLEGDHIWFGTEGGATRFYWNNPLRID